MTNSTDSFRWNNLDEDEADDTSSADPTETAADEEDFSDAAQTRIKQLQQELDQRDAEVEELNTKLDEKEEKFEKLRQEFRDKLDAKNEEIERLEDKVATLEAEQEDLADTLESKNTEVESLKATVRALNKEKDSLQTSINKLEQAQDHAEQSERPTDAPQSVQDDLLEVLEVLEDEVDGAVPYSRLIATAKNSGLPEDALDPALETLLRQGEVVEPFPQQYKRYDGDDAL